MAVKAKLCGMCGGSMTYPHSCQDCGMDVCNLCIVMIDAGDYCISCVKSHEKDEE